VKLERIKCIICHNKHHFTDTDHQDIYNTGNNTDAKIFDEHDNLKKQKRTGQNKKV